jgi:general secretion pathway protein K
LWILAILAILSIGIGGRMGLELKLTGYNRDSAAALYLAKAGVKRAAAVVVSNHKDQVSPVDSLKMEDGSCTNNNEESKRLFKDIKVGETGYFIVSYLFSDKQVFYGVQDEGSRVNINTAPKEVIRNLINYLDTTVNSDDIAGNIEDWRDPGDTRQDSSPEYTQEGYKRKDAPFDSVDEILLVKGVEQKLFDNIKGYITVYTTADSGKININTAPLPVLVALGFNDAKAIISARPGPDAPDNTPFSSKGDFTARLPDVKIAPPANPENIELVSYGSNFFRVISKGYASGGRVVKTVTCVISATDGEILYWNEE